MVQRCVNKKSCNVRKKAYICMFSTKCTFLQMVLSDRLFHQMDTYDIYAR